MFSFYNDQLFAVRVDYATRRTEGLTQADLIEAISAAYGPSARLAVIPQRSSTNGAQGDPYASTPIARWEDASYSITLLRATYPTSFRMILEFPELARLARIADVEAARLDVVEAPQLELARQKKDAAEAAAAVEQSRRVNKPAFKP